MSEWRDDQHVAAYLERADALPRAEAEAILLDELPAEVRRVLDLGSGDGRLLRLVLTGHPEAFGVAVDFSPAMLDLLAERFGSDERVEVVTHDLGQPLGDLGTFDAIVSSFAIHHLEHERKRELYREAWSLLRSGGVFANLDHVASPSPRVHVRFLEAIGYTPDEEDPSNRLLDVETQLAWLREMGFADADCYWKWRELALMLGVRPR
ncbi:MAG: class I SAM-dependent methyltransferase [Coriobacteriales bacterium]|nr:class I SAM-dependent methyltransferase [Coriobacteriales bacterium]